MADHHEGGNPFEGVTDFFSELNRMRRTGVHGREPGLEDWQRTHATAWVPAADIYARGEDLVVKLELAGVDPRSVNLSFTHGVLTVSGSRQADEASEDVSFYVREVTVHGGAGRQDAGRIEPQTTSERPTTRPVT